ncbi:MAG: hypothetical protein M3422_00880 [Actinomycetota bacterium]|nr:hypothetical protein [Actinomycetota bacterium]
MASEPAPRQEDVIQKAGGLIDEHMFAGRNDYGYDRCGCGWVGEGPGWWPHHITFVLGEAGLLFDPAQTTELETLRGELDNVKAVLESVRRKLGTPEGRAISVYAAEVRAERDERQARIDRLELRAAKATAEIEAWWNSHNGAAHASGALMAVHSLLSGKLDVVLQGDQARAALAGDQPTTEEPKHSHGRDCCWECFGGPDSHLKVPNDPACTHEGCATRDVGVRDDTSEDTP